jgi:two-component system OmpR family sensor kinase
MVDKMVAALGTAADSEDRLRRFLADASHELRTPLTTIRAYSELIRTGTLPADPSTREAIGRIESEATRMGVLVEDLLLLARLDQHPALRREDVDIAELARETVDGLVATAPDHALTVRADAHDVNVVGDAEALRQVVSNLVRNAVLHTPPGTHVDVTVSAADDDVALVVVDDGPGMVDEVAAHAFDRFYRPEPGRMRNSSGTGLGLAIVRSVAEAHGGDVSLVTSPGHGARFEVRLPRRRQT